MSSMTKRISSQVSVLAALISVHCAVCSAQEQSSIAVDPSKMPKLGTVDARYVSYNVEMVEVTGGQFWKPYKSAANSGSAASTSGSAEVGESSGPYEYRPPINLSDPRLRKLARALGPSYIRVSGTWANNSYFQNDDRPPLTMPPDGFKQVLTRAEWKGVVDFARATDDKLVTSFAITPGTRDAQGVWAPTQAKALIDYTESIGGSIAAAEFMNEPTFPGAGGAPTGYNPAAFAKDVKVFEPFLRKESPQTILLGPGGVGEGVSLLPPGIKMNLIHSDDILKATGPIFDAFSYHYYGTFSRRCGGNMTIEKAMTAEWLDRTNVAEKFYADLRDQYLPGKPLWLTETAEAACGGDQLAGEFVDTFRFLNQLGSLGQKGVQVVMRNTLASSDYGLLDEDTLQPRPDYWAALLWKRTMGTVVLDPDTSQDQSLRVYAHCSTGRKGSVTVLALNTDTRHEHSLVLPKSSERFELTAPTLDSNQTLLNGSELKPELDGSIGALRPVAAESGEKHLPPNSATFFVISSAHNPFCK